MFPLRGTNPPPRMVSKTRKVLEATPTKSHLRPRRTGRFSPPRTADVSACAFKVPACFEPDVRLVMGVRKRGRPWLRPDGRRGLPVILIKKTVISVSSTLLLELESAEEQGRTNRNNCIFDENLRVYLRASYQLATPTSSRVVSCLSSAGLVLIGILFLLTILIAHPDDFIQ